MRSLQHITEGFRNVYGASFSPQEVEAYNHLQDRMAQYEAEGKPIPENLLNGSHNLMSGQP